MHGIGNILHTLSPKTLVRLARHFSLYFMPERCVIQLPSPLVIELPLKGRIVIIKMMKKIRVTGRAADSVHHLHFL